jgi:hypothetical protein
VLRNVESAQDLSEIAGREFRRSTRARDHLCQTHRFLPSRKIFGASLELQSACGT